jgi:hypothetical protein
MSRRPSPQYATQFYYFILSNLTADTDLFKQDKRGNEEEEEEERGSSNGKSQDPSTCPKCGVTNGHKPDCSNRYRSCWTFGMRKGGVEKG